MPKTPRFINEAGIGKLKLPASRERLVSIGERLYLKLTPGGMRVFCHLARGTAGRPRKFYRLGQWPAMTLAEARKLNAAYRADTDRGIDPTDRQTAPQTVADLYARWSGKAVDKRGRAWSDLYKRNVEQIFNADVLPKIGRLHLEAVRKSDVANLIESILDRGASSHARQVYMRLKRFFNYAVEVDLLPSSPMAGMVARGTANAKERSLGDEEIRAFLSWLPTAAMSRQAAGALELILRTGQRPGECSRIHAREIEGDWWTIPGTRTKNGLPQRVFLAPAAKAVLNGNQAGIRPAGFIFGDPETGQPLHRNSLAKSLRRATTGRETRSGEATLDLDPFAPHDLRRTCGTHLAAMGFSDEIRGAILNHKQRTVTGVHYNCHQYDKEKRLAMMKWDRRLAAILAGKPAAAEVVELATARGAATGTRGTK